MVDLLTIVLVFDCPARLGEPLDRSVGSDES
jgi:hypothetical protein